MDTQNALLSETELESWGERIGREARPPLVLALRGDLGAGKSTLARAVARGAGVAGAIPSPTFNLLFRYDGNRGVRVAHLDLYRLERQDDVWDLGWTDLPDDDELVLIEWPEHAEPLLPHPRWDVEIEETEDPLRRRVSATPVGDPAPLPPMEGA